VNIVLDEGSIRILNGDVSPPLGACSMPLSFGLALHVHALHILRVRSCDHVRCVDLLNSLASRHPPTLTIKNSKRILMAQDPPSRMLLPQRNPSPVPGSASSLSMVAAAAAAAATVTVTMALTVAATWGMMVATVRMVAAVASTGAPAWPACY
jgi:hypothetical protein